MPDDRRKPVDEVGSVNRIGAPASYLVNYETAYFEGAVLVGQPFSSKLLLFGGKQDLGWLERVVIARLRVVFDANDAMVGAGDMRHELDGVCGFEAFEIRPCFYHRREFALIDSHRRGLSLGSRRVSWNQTLAISREGSQVSKVK